jgi:hypothetical protein
VRWIGLAERLQPAELHGVIGAKRRGRNWTMADGTFHAICAGGRVNCRGFHAAITLQRLLVGLSACLRDRRRACAPYRDSPARHISLWVRDFHLHRRLRFTPKTSRPIFSFGQSDFSLSCFATGGAPARRAGACQTQAYASHRPVSSRVRHYRDRKPRQSESSGLVNGAWPGRRRRHRWEEALRVEHDRLLLACG